MDEIDAWNTFLHSGSVPDYLRYRAIRDAKDCTEQPEDDADEVQDQRTDTQTTEYR